MSKRKDKRIRELKRRKRKASRSSNRLYGSFQRTNQNKVPKWGMSSNNVLYSDVVISQLLPILMSKKK